MIPVFFLADSYATTDKKERRRKPPSFFDPYRLINIWK